MARYHNIELLKLAIEEAAREAQDDFYSKMEVWKKIIEDLLDKKTYQLEYKVKTPEEIAQEFLERGFILTLFNDDDTFKMWKKIAARRIKSFPCVILKIIAANKNEVSALNQLVYNKIDWDMYVPYNEYRDDLKRFMYYVDDSVEIRIMDMQTRDVEIETNFRFNFFNLDEERLLAEKLQDRSYICAECCVAFIEMILSNKYGGPYQIDYRVKSPEKIIYKLQTRLGEKAFSSDLFRNINDFDNFDRKTIASRRLKLVNDQVGIRISVDEEDDVLALIKLFDECCEFDDIVDYFDTPKESGFKAFIYYLRIDGINIEIQLMTNKMRDWTNDTHDEYDIKTYGRSFKQRQPL